MYDADPSRQLRPKLPKSLVQFRLRQEIRRIKRKRPECAKRNKPYRLQESPHQIIPLENRLHQFDEIPDG